MNALILVDIQNDFLPNGALPVPSGDRVVPVANVLIERFKAADCPVVATQDSHPADHLSFASQHAGRSVGDQIQLDGLDQILWPDHCVVGTPGSAFAPELNIEAIDKVFEKGTDRVIDSYSGFYDNGHRKATGLGEWLKTKHVTAVTIVGLATDYCVRFTVLDALKLGFEVTVVPDGCRGVDLNDGDCNNAIAEMRNEGAQIVATMNEVLP